MYVRMCVSATHLFVCVTCFVSQVLDQFGVRKSVGYTGQQVGLLAHACVLVFVCVCMYSQRIRTFSSVVTAWASAYSLPPHSTPSPHQPHHFTSSRVIVTCCFRYVWPTMDTYVGEWKEDVRTGHGMMTFQNGEV